MSKNRNKRGNEKILKTTDKNIKNPRQKSFCRGFFALQEIAFL